MEQRSPEWFAARCGSLGASRVHDVISRTKTGPSASRANLMAELLLERLTGNPTESFTTSAMQFGIDTEPEARAAYAWHADVDVVEVGLIRHPTINGSHCSPDGMISDDGLVEIKVPQPAAHLDTLLTGVFPARYITQAQWQLAATGRTYCDLVSYQPKFPERMRLYVRRIERDETFIRETEKAVVSFLSELGTKVAELRARYEGGPSPLLEALTQSVARA